MNKRSKSIVILILLLFFFGCSMKGMVRDDYTALNLGEKRTCRTGDIFFAQRDDPATPGQEPSFDLTILRLSDREIIFKMVEYSRVVNNGESVEKKISWKPLSSVKTFTYPLSEKIISFKGFVFRVLRVKGDAVIYERLR